MTSHRGRGRTLWIIGLLVALVCAGIISYYASSSPDGLEFVAEKLGFIDAAGDHMAASGPLADYQVAGIENERVAGGLAGIIGSLVVLVLSFGLFRVVANRRKSVDAGSVRGG